MKHVKQIISVGFCLALLALAAACNGPFSLPNGGAPNGGDSAAGSSVLIRIAAPDGKTIMPQPPTFSKYELTLLKTGGTPVDVPDTGGIENEGVEVILSPGEWTVTVRAFRNADGADIPVAVGSATVNVEDGASNQIVEINLAPPAGEGDAGNGTFVWDITLPLKTDTAVMILSEWDGGDEILNLNLKDNDNLTGSKELAPGYYELVLALEDDGLKTGRMDVVHIFSGLESVAEFDLRDIVFGSFVEPGEPDSLAGELLILQAYGSSSTAAGVSHSFVELYNNTDAAVDLSDISLYYADGTDAGSGQTNTNTADGAWKRISLAEKTIPAKGSFLILGPRQNTNTTGNNAARYQITDNSGDINDANFTLSNRAFKVALIRSTANLAVQNPFTMDGNEIAEGYIDMVGSANTYPTRDLIFGFETAPTRNSASEAVRRNSLTDTDDNSVDFVAARYASGGMSDELLEVRKPRNSAAGAWNPFADPEPPVVGGGSQLMILQANTYGNDNGGGGGFPSSLVELYNNTDAAINLGTGNYYLHIGNATTWTHVIALTGTIPAKSSFLVVSTTDSSSNGQRALLSTADQSADFAIINSNFKVALMRNQNAILTVNNPFTETSLSADYVDMLGVGTANGYETAAASAPSRPQARRRTSLADTDNNSADFGNADYRGYTGSNGVADNELYKYWPRNSTSGTWDPITGLPAVHPIVGGDPGDGPEPETTPDALQGKLLILQAYGSSSSAAGISHSFVELYNNTDAAINLNGIGLYYADGTDAGSGQTNTATKDGDWERISLDGKTIPAKGSFLVLSSQQSPTAARYQIPDNSGDINEATFTLSNRAFKVAVIRSTDTLTAQNPFDIGEGKKILGYIDMVGAANTYPTRDLIFGFETAPTRNSASEAVRRKDLTDTDNNSVDFVAARYASGGMSDELLEVRKPRNSAAGAWNPFADPEQPVVGEGSQLMILQANTYGNNTGGFESSLVELYNNTDAAINLGTGNYYLHIGSTGTPGWTYAIALAGTIPSKSSFLIRTTNTSDIVATTPFLLPVADQTADFRISNDNFKVAIITGAGQTMLTVDNPFTSNGGQPITGYVDMLGVGNATGFETSANATSRPQPPRRTSLTDTNNNSTDFARYDSRSDNGGIAENQLYKYWPRNSTMGSWDPITGEAAVHPQRRN